ncbi:cytochrome c biogenesis heme-transporting ATPase CcmA [Acidovorax sp. Be4]|uniref:Cytochrome c biogenesis heme-transporting ATPase CcmA n=1 Tax=Acidovorax bellezanensis TaxID=2976702 RepID=A0ABT2PID9_9BURK|nr:cytochrome c biogenesis heme-transporting ATPase CcmA [Acidovorax sp. Be4]MCT9809943.1 cytochrome c biogenesis heme-transporting ATPase CcmA [Acidovorax sp. Be4]
MGGVAFSSLHLAVSGWGCVRNGRVLFRQLAFELASGQALVLKGRNGAGKSTLLRSLAGLLPWRAGALSWGGQSVRTSDAAYQQQLAYLGHQAGMSDALTGLENLQFALAMGGIAWNPAQAAPVLRALALNEVASRPLGRLSQGQRRRLGLARVVLSERPVWLLDEPDSSLDDAGGACLGQVLTAHLAAGGMAVVATHHGLALPQALTRTLDLSAPRETTC